MKKKRLSGIILMFVGVILFLFAHYIQVQVAEGRGKISSAQKQVDTGNSLFSMSPYTEDVGKMATGSMQKQIDEGQHKVDMYHQLSRWLYLGSVIVFIVGLGLLIFSFRRNK